MPRPWAQQMPARLACCLLALLRAGQTQRCLAELETAEETVAKIPHTWVNLVPFHAMSSYPYPSRPALRLIRSPREGE
jgi:hypothetical protein